MKASTTIKTSTLLKKIRAQAGVTMWKHDEKAIAELLAHARATEFKSAHVVVREDLYGLNLVGYYADSLDCWSPGVRAVEIAGEFWAISGANLWTRSNLQAYKLFPGPEGSVLAYTKVPA